eukprot:COSAG01_NODE_8597_length_2724_cov_1.964952_6_plen_155_part_01
MTQLLACNFAKWLQDNGPVAQKLVADGGPKRTHVNAINSAIKSFFTSQAGCQTDLLASSAYHVVIEGHPSGSSSYEAAAINKLRALHGMERLRKRSRECGQQLDELQEGAAQGLPSTAESAGNSSNRPGNQVSTDAEVYGDVETQANTAATGHVD